MSYCVHCGLPVRSDCDHPQTIEVKRPKVVRVERNRQQEQSIHPRVRNGRTVHAKVNTAKAANK